VAEHFALVVFGLLVAVAGLVLLSNIFNVPYPIFLGRTSRRATPRRRWPYTRQLCAWR
jgi:hypothetical protein